MAKKKTAAAKKAATEREHVAEDLAQQNADAASGQTEAQQEMLEYHKGDFQKFDPITGEERDLDEPLRVARADRGETVEDVAGKRK